MSSILSPLLKLNSSGLRASKSSSEILSLANGLYDDHPSIIKGQEVPIAQVEEYFGGSLPWPVRPEGLLTDYEQHLPR